MSRDLPDPRFEACLEFAKRVAYHFAKTLPDTPEADIRAMLSARMARTHFPELEDANLRASVVEVVLALVEQYRTPDPPM